MAFWSRREGDICGNLEISAGGILNRWMLGIIKSDIVTTNNRREKPKGLTFL
jgi:hypothetical protein